MTFHKKKILEKKWAKRNYLGFNDRAAGKVADPSPVIFLQKMLRRIRIQDPALVFKYLKIFFVLVWYPKTLR